MTDEETFKTMLKCILSSKAATAARQVTTNEFLQVMEDVANDLDLEEDRVDRHRILQGRMMRFSRNVWQGLTLRGNRP